MKKIVAVLIVLMLFALPTSFAKIGDVVGNIYSTDIKAYINGVLVKSYCIDGKTCVAIEEVTRACSYDNGYRMLLVHSFAPRDLIPYSENTKTTKIGKVVGHLYETDIKTFFYDKEIVSYSIGGRTAVALEDLGINDGYSDIGGKTKWDPDNRTISLDYLYNSIIEDDFYNTLAQNKLSLDVVGDEAIFKPSVSTPGIFSSSLVYEKYYEEDSYVDPIYMNVNGTSYVVGYNFCSPNRYFYYDENDNVKLQHEKVQFFCFDLEVLKALASGSEKPAFTREEVISDLMESWMGEVIQRYDTDDYTFIYLKQPTPHGNSEVIVYVRSDGTYKTYGEELQTAARTRHLEDLTIDKENEKVEFLFKSQYFVDIEDGAFVVSRYTIDLKTGDISHEQLGGA